MRLFKVIDSTTYANVSSEWIEIETDDDISVKNKIYDDTQFVEVIKEFKFFVSRIRINRNIIRRPNIDMMTIDSTDKITVEGYDNENSDERLCRVIKIQEISEISNN